ncbi:MAG: ribosomal RNA small subunit methyltransferase A [Candidatus Omnitrophota bacterium]|nr:MAG: ribosomal RNA small subunit methyltransferase A [Candidatus Omnitrophota bacterium]
MKPSRSLGQVFLRDKTYVKRILSSLDFKGKVICEIGSGRGEVSQYLVRNAKFLYCVELDLRFCELLQKQFGHLKNVKIIHQDILKLPLSSLPEKLIVFGNVPYQISNHLIRYLVHNRARIERAYLTLQKEFAQKLIAKAARPNYGFLSCYAQYYARITKLFDIPRQAFMPRPKVNSSFIAIEFYPQPIHRAVRPELLFEIIRKAFLQRRKKIINSLPFLKGKDDLLDALNISPAARAQELPLKTYVDLANRLTQGAYRLTNNSCSCEK